MSRDKPQDHNWIPHAYFEHTNYNRFATLILYCPHCKAFRYQYGEPVR